MELNFDATITLLTTATVATRQWFTAGSNTNRSNPVQHYLQISQCWSHIWPHIEPAFSR